MRVLIIGGGGREHALAWKVAQSPQVDRIWVAPGNAGTALESKCENINIHVDDCERLVQFAKENAIDLTIVGPEAALAAGIVNSFNSHGLHCFGPSRQAAMLESSKGFCKDFFHKYKIPTAAYGRFNKLDEALAYVRQQSIPVVIKADGLAAGKGVVIAETLAQAEAAIISMLDEHKFGNASNSIVIEEFLEGEELSYIVMVDGENVLPMASSQDHKRRDNGDQGPNTGGMGAFSPAHLLTEKLEKKILKKIIKPTVAAMIKEGTPYFGFLYAGIMIDKKGEPKMLEYNCRLGDPETQPLLMRLESDLVELIQAAMQGKLNEMQAVWNPQTALSVILTAGGYPLAYKKGDIIEGIDTINDNDVKVFHAGTKLNDDKLVTNGGRVLAVTALGDSVNEAQEKAYQNAEKIHWPNVYFRTDIGHKALDVKHNV